MRITATQELVAVEQQLTDALVRNEVATVDRLWSDDLIFVGTNGKTATKAQRLESMKTPSNAVTTTTNDDVKVRVYGQTAVVTLLSTWNVRVDGRESSDRYMTTHVWSKQRGRWLLVMAHVSRVAP
jgi:ketosteroid isomerase-like protein